MIQEIEIQDSTGLREQLNAPENTVIERKGRIGEAPLIMYWDDTIAPVPSQSEIQAAELSALVTHKTNELRAATQASILQPLTSNVLGSDHVYPTDKDTQQNVHGLVTKATIYPAEGPFPVWCTPAGADDWRRRGHGDEQIKALGNRYVAHVSVRQDQYELLLG